MSPTFFGQVSGFFNVPYNLITDKGDETGPTVYSPYPRRLESRTINFADVITKAALSPQLSLRPWVLNHRSGVCATVENSPNPSSVYIRLCKHRKTVFYCFYKITFSQNYNAGKDKKIHFTDQNVSSYNMNLTMAFLNWPTKTYISKSSDGAFTTRVSLHLTTTFHTVMWPRLSANQSVHTILVIL